ncbi:MAG: zinc-ribbon domain-containing protein [Lachnospiraceae bacterium]|nr:zinc-ribbon domain-containing protein [Lachnospiraceae bacterium]
MFCGKCGTENEEGAKFCKSCGNPLEKVESGINTEKAKQTAANVISKVKGLPKKVLIGGAAAIVALIVIICIVSNANNTINLNKYLKIEEEGSNGYGTINATVDWKAIETKYGDKIKLKGSDKKELSELGGYFGITAADLLEECISIKVDKDEKLSNGDKVAYTWEIDEDFDKNFDCKIKYKNGTYKVSKLKKAGKIDMFADLEVEFSGISPNGEVEIESGKFSSSDFKCDKTSGLKNGDVVKVSLINTDDEYYMEKYGNAPKATSKKYKVSGLEEYVSSYSQLDDKLAKKLEKIANDKVNEYITERSMLIENLEDCGHIIHIVDEGNELYYVYKGDRTTESKTVYLPVCIKNVKKDQKGKFSYDEENISIIEKHGLFSAYLLYDDDLKFYRDCIGEVGKNENIEAAGYFERYAYCDVTKTMAEMSDNDKEYFKEAAKNDLDDYFMNDASGEHFRNAVSEPEYIGDYLRYKNKADGKSGNKNWYGVVYKVSYNYEGVQGTTYIPIEFDLIRKYPDGEWDYDEVHERGRIKVYLYHYIVGYNDTALLYKEMFEDIIGCKVEISDAVKELVK